ncbi:Glucose-methanol-choline oxidoreductase, C-terminal [Dillenia turbinata]|uniref:Glucose-methanol-choline oxidoreductase, C-terminal n=1 Tax=Dillenia turbinata TaxID=194707 RepID=A0AAN8Z1R4_9MAGN
MEGEGSSPSAEGRGGPPPLREGGRCPPPPSTEGEEASPSPDLTLLDLIFSPTPIDLDHCIPGMRKIVGILSNRSMEYFEFTDMGGRRDFRFVGPTLPFYLSDDILMVDFCHHTVNAIWHYHGVVNHDFRVIGMDALQIVDGSSFNISLRTNPQATLMMLGRYIRLKIIKNRL